MKTTNRGRRKPDKSRAASSDGNVPPQDDLAALIANAAQPSRGRKKAETLTGIFYNQVKRKKINWLWPKHFALGKLSMILGVPGLGKSLMALDAAARVSRGSNWPDGSPGIGKPASIIILSNEDDIADTSAPRAAHMGADLAKLYGVKAAKDSEEGGSRDRPLNLTTDIDALREKIAEIGDVSLVVIDPLSAYLGGINTDKNADVRSALTELEILAQETKVAVVSIMHMNKSGTQEVIHRASGSVAFMALMRTAFLITLDPRDLETKLFLPFKNNLSPMKGLGRRFTIEGADDAGNTQKVKIVWAEQVDIEANAALAALSKRQHAERDGGAGLNHAMETVRAILGKGPMLSDELAETAKEMGGVSERTLRRAREALRVRAFKQKGDLKGPWWVSLPPEPVQNIATPAVRPPTGRRRKFAR